MATEMLYEKVYTMRDVLVTLLVALRTTPKWRVIKRLRLKRQIRCLKLELNSIYGEKSCGTTLDKH